MALMQDYLPPCCARDRVHSSTINNIRIIFFLYKPNEKKIQGKRNNEVSKCQRHSVDHPKTGEFTD